MPSPTDRITVLVVDDDPGVLGSLRFLLETEGFDVRTFRSGAALLRSSETAGCDCFVIDYKLEDMNGLDLASQLRERRIEAPIIMITGYPDKEVMAKAATVGAREVLLKPHLEDSLAAHVRSAVRERPRHAARA
jgi:two-component system, LuxR family, response regulator FixJ